MNKINFTKFPKVSAQRSGASILEEGERLFQKVSDKPGCLGRLKTSFKTSSKLRERKTFQGRSRVEKNWEPLEEPGSWSIFGQNSES